MMYRTVLAFAPVRRKVRPPWNRALRIAIAVTTIALAALSGPSLASDDFPIRPIRLVVPYPPGGGIDDVARLVGQKVAGLLGQPVIIENKPGAGGILGGDAVARAAPDGYTLLIDNSSLVINPSLYPKLPFDVARDLAPVTLASTQDSMLLAHPSLAARTVTELIALAKARPGKLNYASPRNGSPQHIGMEMFNLLAGTQMVHIPYKGGAPATNALLAGEVDLLLSGTTGLPHVRSGKARALATTGGSRSSLLPDVPTVAESGLRDYSSTNWQAILVPARTPASVVARLNKAFVEALKSPDIARVLTERNFVVVASTPSELARTIEEGLASYRKLIRETGIKPD